jgi:hypothetical protein
VTVRNSADVDPGRQLSRSGEISLFERKGRARWERGEALDVSVVELDGLWIFILVGIRKELACWIARVISDYFLIQEGNTGFFNELRLLRVTYDFVNLAQVGVRGGDNARTSG